MESFAHPPPGHIHTLSPSSSSSSSSRPLPHQPLQQLTYAAGDVISSMTIIHPHRLLLVHDPSGAPLYDRVWAAWRTPADAGDLTALLLSLRQFGREVSGGELLRIVLDDDDGGKIEALVVLRGDIMGCLFHGVDLALSSSSRDDPAPGRLLEHAITQFRVQRAAAAATAVTLPSTGATSGADVPPPLLLPGLDSAVDAALLEAVR